MSRSYYKQVFGRMYLGERAQHSFKRYLKKYYNNRLKNTMKKEIDLSYNNSLYKKINMANYEYMRQWICFPANDGDGYDIRNFTKKEKSR